MLVNGGLQSVVVGNTVVVVPAKVSPSREGTDVLDEGICSSDGS